MSKTVYLEFTQGTSNKFWEGTQDGAELTTRWGKVGTNGQSKTKDFDDDAKALTALEKAAKAKIKKGYVEVSATESTEQEELPPATEQTTPSPTKAPPAKQAAPPETSPPTTPTTAPAITADALEDRLVWTDEVLAKVAPTRSADNSNLPPVEIDPAKVLAQRGKRDGKDHRFVGLDRFALRAKHANAWMNGHVDDLDLEGVITAMVFSSGDLLDRAIRFSAGTFGVLETLEAYIESLEFAYETTSNDKQELTYSFDTAEAIALKHQNSYSNPLVYTLFTRHPNLVTLRRLALLLSDDDYARLTASADKVFGELPTPHKVVLAALIPDHGDWASELEPEISQTYSLQQCHNTLLFATTDIKLLTKLFKRDSYHHSPFNPFGYASLVHNIGPEVLGLFEKRPRYQSAMMEAAAVVHSTRGASYWCGVVEEDQKHFKDTLAALLQQPLHALVGLSRVERAMARSLSAAIAQHDLASVHAAIATGQGVLKHLEALLPPTPEQLADDAMLPGVLLAPPWKQKKKRQTKPATFTALTSPQLETTLSIPEDIERDLRRRYSYVLSREDEDLDEQDERLEKSIMSYVNQPNAYSWYISRQSYNLMLMRQESSMRAVWDKVPRDFWRLESGDHENLLIGLIRHGDAILDIVLELGRRRIQAGVPALQYAKSVEIARLMSEGFARTKSIRGVARDWIDANPIYTLLAITPLAFGKEKKPRNYAEKTLAHLSQTQDHEALLDAAREHFDEDVVAALKDVLERDPLDLLPKKLPKLPTWLTPRALPALVFEQDTAKRLSDTQVMDVLQMLAFFDPENRYPGIDQLLEVFTERSLDEFSLAVCELWLTMDGSSKSSWALHAVGALGHDEAVRKLTPKIRKWPGESAAKRAQWGLDVLASIGTDVALMNVYNISQKIKYKSLKAHAAKLVDQVAEERGLTRIELGDRLVPDFDLDRRGRITLDYGARTFEISFDEQLQPIIRNEAGKVVKSLPKPGKSDDAELAKASKSFFSGMKKDLKTVAKQQLQRLEGALVQQRKWGSGDFVAFLVEHPLMINLTHRLLWGCWSAGELVATFRVDQDHSFLDQEDEPVDITGHEIGLIHPAYMSDEAIRAWQTVIADYEIIQPFDQLGRLFLDQEAAFKKLEEEVIGASLPAPKLVFGLEKFGWERGPAEDGGAFYYHTKELADGTNKLIIAYEGCVAMGWIEEDEQLEVEALYVAEDYRWSSGRETTLADNLDNLNAITLSEVTQELASITASTK